MERWPKHWLNVWPLADVAVFGSLVRFLILSDPNRGRLFAAGMGVHLSTVIACVVLAHSLGAALSPLDALILLPPVILLTAIPITIGGWGVREGAMVAALGLVGIPAHLALAISVLLGLAVVVIGLLGGGVWLVSKDRASVDPGPSDKATSTIQKP
jgi:uncharacterized membrane protein YbhN (UPF0104 family)